MAGGGKAKAGPLKGLPPNVGPQGKKLWEAQQVKAAKDASQKRLNFEKEALLAEKRLVDKKIALAAQAEKRASKKRRRSLPDEGIQSEEDGRYWGPKPGEEKDIPELDEVEELLEGNNGPQPEDEIGSGQDGEGAQEEEEDDGAGSEEEGRLRTIERHGPRDPPAPVQQVEPATASRSQAASNRLALALRKSTSDSGHRRSGGSGGSVRSIVKVGEVDERYLIAPGRGEDTSVERAMAVTALTGWAVGCDPYPKPGSLMYYRAVLEGMPPRQEDGSENDPKEFFGVETYNYLSHWHTKRMSSARAEFAGTKNIRGIFNQYHHFTPSLCKSDEAAEAMMAKGRALIKDGAWHTDEEGNPFSSDVFVAIMNSVWKTEGCLVTGKQLVWTCLVVETHLLDKNLAIDRDVNARAMDKHGVEVVKVLNAAKKAKKKMAFKKREVNKAIDLAAATKAFMADGGGKKKGKKKRGAQDLERDEDVWDAMEKFNDDDEPGEEA